MTEAATNPSSGDQELIARVLAKRADIENYLRSTGRRSHLLLNLAIVGGSTAAALTAAPALGGKPLADWITETFGLDQPSWRLLCAVACICSIVATVASQMRASHSYEDHIMRAQSVKAALEVLEISIRSGTVDRDQAVAKLGECIEGSSFVPTAR